MGMAAGAARGVCAAAPVFSASDAAGLCVRARVLLQVRACMYLCVCARARVLLQVRACMYVCVCVRARVLLVRQKILAVLSCCSSCRLCQITLLPPQKSPIARQKWPPRYRPRPLDPDPQILNPNP